jgi:AcrR family transcriptional regulator
MTEASAHEASAQAFTPGADRAPKRRGRPLTPGASDAILEATIALAAEDGFAALTIDAIAARAGVGRPTIYRRWPSKEALLDAAVTKIVEDLRQPDTGDIRSDLILHVIEMIHSIQSPSGTVYLAYTFEPEWSHLGAAAQERCRDRNRDMIRRAVARGELLPNTDPDLLLDLLTGFVWLRGHVHHQHMEDALAQTIVDSVLPQFLVERSQRRPLRIAWRRSD